VGSLKAEGYQLQRWKVIFAYCLESPGSFIRFARSEEMVCSVSNEEFDFGVNLNDEALGQDV
jgi:hypothetical protein